MKHIPFLILVAACLTGACNNNEENEEPTGNIPPISRTFTEIKKAQWLLGSWKSSTSHGIALESWQVASDSSFTGVSHFIQGKDTVSSESIRLVQDGNDLLYIPTVKNQNNSQPVTFRMTSSTNDQFVFENPAHEYPQKITYTRISSDSLLAVVSGKMDGKENVQQFPMRKLKD
ncbi:MAG: hypothetical protein K0Q66_2119 [Chitinophagaceae bacterium]|jgi:hypothetical protein|nr:hypothetical protein [Chitinophagaceae bacterium]